MKVLLQGYIFSMWVLCAGTYNTDIDKGGWNVAISDVWVSVGKRLENTIDEISLPDASYLTGISSYNIDVGDQSEVVFLATDTSKRGDAPVYMIQRNNVTKIYEDKTTTYFEGVGFSKNTNTIYLTSPSTQSIISLGPTGPNTYKMEGMKPSGLVVDSCTSTVFWTSTARDSGSIMAWREGDGSPLQSKVLIHEGLTKPRGLSLDSSAAQIYWVDQRRNRFSIMRSALNGTNVETVLSKEEGEPFSLAVTPSWIYWSDWSKASVYRIEKINPTEPELVKKYTASKPNGITYVSNQSVSCETRSPVTFPPSTTSSTDSINQSTVPTANNNKTNHTDKSSNMFCMEGEIDSDGLCDCNEGWTGQHCQINLCHNYCLSGLCRVAEDHPICFCSDGYTGNRCELKVEISPVLPVQTMNYLVFVFPGVMAIQFIVIIILSVFLHRNRKRPRVVRKRFISASKYAEKVEKKTPGSCSGSGLPTEDGIQLDIEDCCNMSMCDTPCFDPPNRVPKKIGKKSGRTLLKLLMMTATNQPPVTKPKNHDENLIEM